MISPEDRELALKKIDALLGADEPQLVKIECMLDGRVRKSLEVEAIDGIINGRSIQANTSAVWLLFPSRCFSPRLRGIWRRSRSST